MQRLSFKKLRWVFVNLLIPLLKKTKNTTHTTRNPSVTEREIQGIYRPIL